MPYVNWHLLTTLSDDDAYELLTLWQSGDMAEISRKFPTLCTSSKTDIALPVSAVCRLAIYTTELYDANMQLTEGDGATKLLQAIAQRPPLEDTQLADDPSLAAITDWSRVFRLVFPKGLPGEVNFFNHADSPEIRESMDTWHAKHDNKDVISDGSEQHYLIPEEIIAQLDGKLIACGNTITYGGTPMMIAMVSISDLPGDRELTKECTTAPFTRTEHNLSMLTLIPTRYVDLTR